MNIRKTLLSLAIAPAVMASTISTAAHADEWHGMVGIGGGYIDSPWKGMDSFPTAVPFVSLEYGNWELLSNGLVTYKWIAEDEFSFYTGIDYRDDTYDPDNLPNSEKSDDPVFKGYKSPDGDLTFKAGGHWMWFGIDVQQDISDQSEGLTVDGGVEIPLIQMGEFFSLNATAGVHWLSSKYANHVYGIQGNQIDVAQGRTAYLPDSVTNYSLGLEASYFFDEQWGVFAGVNYTKLDEKIEKSPLIDSDKSQYAYIGVAYIF